MSRSLVAVLLALALFACGPGKPGGSDSGPGGSSATLTVTVAGDGLVTSSPGGLDCPGGPCSVSLPVGTAVTLTAAANPAAFLGWSGACAGSSPTCTLTLTGDLQAAAQFAASHTLAVTVNGPGTVSSSPAGIQCPATCSASFDDASVSLTAAPQGAAVFSGWSGACSGSGACTVALSADAAVTATFANPPPALGLAPTVVQIILPQDCPAQFTITNTGPQGSTLAYTVADDGTLGGFLDVVNATGSLQAGTSQTVSVTVKPEFVGTEPTVVNDNLVLNVYTPGASNYAKFPVSVQVRDASVVVGSWAGAWSGLSYSSGDQSGSTPGAPTAAVSGTWSLSLDSVDLDAGTATGSLVWDGTDATWTDDGDGNPVSQPFVADRTLDLQGAYVVTTFQAITNVTLCPPSFQLSVNGFANAPNPSDAFYGPSFNPDLYSDGTLIGTQASWSAHPYTEGGATFVSSGQVTGGKVQ